MLSNVDEVTPDGSARTRVVDGITFVFPGDGRSINSVGQIPKYPPGAFDLIISDARSPELDPAELVRLLKPGGVGYFGNWAALGGGSQLELRDLRARIAETDARVEALVGPWPLHHPIDRSAHLAHYGLLDKEERLEELALRLSLHRFVIKRPAAGFRDRVGR